MGHRACRHEGASAPLVRVNVKRAEALKWLSIGFAFVPQSLSCGVRMEMRMVVLWSCQGLLEVVQRWSRRIANASSMDLWMRRVGLHYPHVVPLFPDGRGHGLR